MKIYSKLVVSGALGLLALGAGGCASIVKGTTQAIPVSSSPSGATVRLDGNHVGQTPTSVEVKRKSDHLVTIEKTGYQPESVAITRNIGGAVFGNILAGGVIGWGVDAVSGAQYNLTPATISVSLTPNTSQAKTKTVSASKSDAAIFINELQQLDALHEANKVTDEEYAKLRGALIEKYSPSAPKPSFTAEHETDASNSVAEGLEEAAENKGLYVNMTPGVYPKTTEIQTSEFSRTLKLAMAGDPSMQFNLGVNYAKGIGVKKSSADAVKWYRKSAEQGFAKAQANLAFMYANGEGVPKDLVQAHMWWNIAGVQGLEEARKSLAIVEKEMSAEQKASAMDLARVKFEEMNQTK